MQYFSKIREVKETENGTYIILHIKGKVKEQIERYKNSAAIDSELFIDDKRRISTEQREKIWATIDDIANYFGWIKSTDLKEILVEEFCKERDIEIFSLSRRSENAASLMVAREFITYLIDFAIEWEVPLLDLAINRTEDIDAYIYSCIARRVCCITGKPNADIHHVTGSRVGMGRNRKSIDHSKLEILPLCRKLHDKVHQEGEYKLFKQYKVYGIVVDYKALDKLGLNYEDIS